MASVGRMATVFSRVKGMSSRFRGAVLAYHSQDIQGNDYHNNDHVALAEDIHLLADLKLPLMSAIAFAEAFVGKAELPERFVVLTCDDGAAPDFVNVVDPVYGPQRSFYNILSEAASQLSDAVMTSFVIADPEARSTLELTCLDGRPWMGDSWWAQAVATGRWHLGCHSWDHQHPTLPDYSLLASERTLFRAVDNEKAAQRQIAEAATYLRQRVPNPGDRLFAYPFGNWTEYLIRDYLPKRMDEHGLLAAFTTQPEVLHEGCDRWLLPRFVCRADWKSPDGLVDILKQLN